MNLSREFVARFVNKNFQHLNGFTRACHHFVDISTNNEDLIVNFDNEKNYFPLVWLRDNCTCDKCFHKSTQSRIINWNAFNIDTKVKSIETLPDNTVTLIWDDGHRSKYNYEWLKERSFNEKNQQKFLIEFYRPPKILWDGKDIDKKLKQYNYEDVFNNDTVLYNWLVDLAQYGVVFLQNAPINQHECRKLASKIAFIRKTHYGEEFHVTAKPNTSNVAYLSGHLQMHTDLPYYEYTPGVTVLHCLAQTKGDGGENLLTDVFYVAEVLRKEHKAMFDILNTVEVNWLDIGEEDGVKYHSIFRAPMIKLDVTGNIDRVYHSIPQRDSYFTVEKKYVKPWYEALRIFVDLLQKHTFQFKCKPGEMFAFDNLRVAHGRLNYNDTPQNQRHLIGIYLDWDEIYSKIRVLQSSSAK